MLTQGKRWPESSGCCAGPLSWSGWFSTSTVSGPDSPSWLNPMEPLRVVGEAIGRSVTAGHWPAGGPTDEHLSQIADNLSRARHLVGQDGRPAQSAISEVEANIQHRGQVWTHAAAAASLNQVNPRRAGCQG